MVFSIEYVLKYTVIHSVYI